MPSTIHQRTPELVARARELFTPGRTMRSVAAEMGTPYVTVRRALTLGAAKDGAARPVLTAEMDEKIRKLRVAGHSHVAISRMTGIAKSSVGRRCMALDQEAAARFLQQREAVPAAHREGGGNSPVAPAALPPNNPGISVERLAASFRFGRGMSPQRAMEEAQAHVAFRVRHGSQHGGRGR